MVDNFYRQANAAAVMQARANDQIKAELEAQGHKILQYQDEMAVHVAGMNLAELETHGLVSALSAPADDVATTGRRSGFPLALASFYGLAASLGVPLPDLPAPRPARQLTDADHEALAKAEEKRARRAAKRR